PDDRNAQPVEVRLVLAHGERVEESLRRMRYVCFSGREHADVRGDVVGYESGHSGFRVSDHHYIDVQRLQRENRVQHALALDAGGELDFQVDDIRAQPFRRQLERHTRTCRGLREQVRDGDAAQRVADRGTGAEGPHMSLSTVEQSLDGLSRKLLERQEMAQAAVCAQLIHHPRLTHLYLSPDSQRSRITAAAALSICSRVTRRRRSPAARRALSASAASRDDQRSSTMFTGRPNRCSSSDAKRRAAGASAPGLPSTLYGAPTTSSPGCSALTCRPMASQSGWPAFAGTAVRGAAVRVSVSPEAMPIRLRPKSKARTVWIIRLT